MPPYMGATAPRYIAGADIVKTKAGRCGQCKCDVMVAMIPDQVGTLKWRNLESKPIEHDGRRFYLRHACPR